MRRFLLLLLPLLAAASPGPDSGADLQPGRDRVLPGGARLSWTPCWFEPPSGAQVACAHFLPSTPAGRNMPVRIPVVVFRSDVQPSRGSPVFYLPGGPGAAAGLDQRGIDRWWNWIATARWPHDLVLADVRGAGLSEPSLDCHEVRDADRAALAQPLSAREDLRRFRRAAAACYARIEAQGIEPDRFTPPVLACDAAELLALLGGTDWNLWAVSYGTRLGLQLLRLQPQRFRAAVLDSAYPPEVNGLLAKPGQFDAVRAQAPDACERDADCRREHPALGRLLQTLLTRLARAPIGLSVEPWPGRAPLRVAVNDYRLLWFLFLDSYASSYDARAVPALTAAGRGDSSRLVPLAELFVKDLLDRDFSYGLYFSATCAEDLPGVSRAGYEAEVRRHPEVARYVGADWDEHACRAWPVAPNPPDFTAPVASGVPTLFLNGARDRVTPAALAHAAARRFTRGAQLTLSGSSHTVTLTDACAMAVAWEFLGDPIALPWPVCVAGGDRAAAFRQSQAAPR